MSDQILILSIGVFSFLLGQMILILLSIKWFNSIRLICSNIDITNKRFSSIYINAQDEVAHLYQKITELADVTVQLEEIDVNLRILLQEFRAFALISNIPSQSKEQ